MNKLLSNKALFCVRAKRTFKFRDDVGTSTPYNYAPDAADIITTHAVTLLLKEQTRINNSAMFAVGQRCASNFWYHGIVCRSSESRASEPASYKADGKPILFHHGGSPIEIHARLPRAPRRPARYSQRTGA